MRGLTELKEGHVFVRDNERFFVVDINRPLNQVVLQNVRTEKRDYVELPHLYQAVADGRLTYVQSATGQAADAPVVALTDTVLSELSKAEFSFRLRAVKEVERLLSEGHPACQAYEQCSYLEPEPSSATVRCASARTVRRWYSQYRRKGQQALVPGHSRKGRTKSELTLVQEELIRKVVHDNSEKAHLSIKDLCTKTNLQLTMQSSDPNAIRPISYARVRSVVVGLPWVVRHAHKFEPKLRRAITSFGVDSYKVQWPFERVEMDYCKLPVIALFGKSGKPVEVWSSVAIDVATGHLLAAEVFTRPPNGTDALQTFQRACYGMEEAEFERAAIKNRLRVTGAISEVVVDNGSEFRNGSFTQLATLGVKVTFAPSYSPYRKPFVERAIGALKAFVGSLPGSTVNHADRSVTDPEQGVHHACVTVDDLQAYINGFIFDDYALRTIGRHAITTCLLGESAGLTPTDRMTSKLASFTPAPPPSQEAFRLARMVRHQRSLQKAGIEFETLHYSSAELRDLYNEIGVSTRSRVVPDKLDIYVDPIDVRTIHVVHPITKQRLPAHLKYDLPFAMTYEHFREARDFARSHFKSESSMAITQAFHIRVMGAVEELERDAKSSRTAKKARRSSAAFIEKAKAATSQPSLEQTAIQPEVPALPLLQPTLAISSLKPAQRHRRPGK
ncbi:Mu transposase C-terminal domain-containing protein [Pusillimonas sp. NJUB218]|uniref:Mu transposase C-terminal domain-containing protein n=1 Tax=Pusillimonas sp. NJUB218 TaxID=2023230 RepID=UPI000F4CA781|nr:Mu transposase C-terminal domain-containing protein [Pusillimonas sp. NJUB218]ROT43932.1 hypothetical protein CHR62_15000 [Pusillimonas sp. NJUB218]